MDFLILTDHVVKQHIVVTGMAVSAFLNVLVISKNTDVMDMYELPKHISCTFSSSVKTSSGPVPGCVQLQALAFVDTKRGLLAAVDAALETVHIIDVCSSSRYGFVDAPGAMPDVRHVAVRGCLLAVCFATQFSLYESDDGLCDTWTRKHVIDEKYSVISSSFVGKTPLLLVVMHPFHCGVTQPAMYDVGTHKGSVVPVCMRRSLSRTSGLGEAFMGGTISQVSEYPGGGYVCAGPKGVLLQEVETAFNGLEFCWLVKSHSEWRLGDVKATCVVPGVGVFVATEVCVRMLVTHDQLQQLRMTPCRVAWMTAVVRRCQ